MRYIPNTDEDLKEMLREIGVKNVEELFAVIPVEIRKKCSANLPEPLSEPELIKYIKGVAEENADCGRQSCFLGAGAYKHFIPAVIDTLISRAEFYTAYTPYQPEISQGTLQAIFEYQTLICQLTAMEVSNASLYDGASALAEAALMAHRVTKKEKLLISEAVHPEYVQAVKTYCQNIPVEIVSIPINNDGSTQLNSIKSSIDESTASVILQSPNFFGVIEDVEEAAKIAHSQEAVQIQAIAEPISLGLLKPPGEMGVDITIGEGQSFGLPISFGGPYLGFMATLDKYKRSLPGRLSGQTLDVHGQEGYVLTLATREQHIRREKATSNICTNQALCALMACIYLTWLGKQGLKELAQQNLQKAHYAFEALSRLNGCKPKFSGPFFNEFVIEFDRNPEPILDSLLEKNILAGLPLKGFYSTLENCLLLCVTELVSKSEIDNFANELKRLL
jgi:glycine dehydrogenase subunit 1